MERPSIFLTAASRSVPGWWHRRSGTGFEFGDWYTWFLTPHGTIGTSFVHLFFPWQVMAEARAAGFARVERAGKGHFVAAEFRE